MPDPHDASPASPRSGLTPGAWAAVSAIAVAMIGGGVTLTTAWWSHRPASTSQAEARPTPPASTPVAADKPQAEARPEAKPDVAGLVGHWSGTARADGETPQRVEVEVASGCAAGADCGWIAVPDVPCKGRITLVGSASEGLEFRVDRFDAASDAQRCQPGGGEVLRAAGDGTVLYTATYSGARGVLRPASQSASGSSARD